MWTKMEEDRVGRELITELLRQTWFLFWKNAV